MNLPVEVVLSCEHAGNDVPAPFAPYFDSPEANAALVSHRGWDPGSLPIGEAMAGTLGVPLVVQSVTRLLVECNRSLDHPKLFSEFSSRMPEAERQEVVERYWRPHREQVKRSVAATDRPVVHVGVHTFTPVWKGRERATDIGLLFDPSRAIEAEVVRAWRTQLLATAGRLPVAASRAPGPVRIHLNRPYRGWTDGLITSLRQEWPPSRYVGIELEVSQRIAVAHGPELGHWIAAGLRDGLTTMRETALAG